MLAMDQQQHQQLHELLNPSRNKKTKKKSNNNNKRRFSDEQINSLEAIFESQSKLDPKKKLQLARELGLHPRQVAIWFQNKRARYKSKQLEAEYSSLKASYNSLASRFEALKKEKQALANQLEKLRNEVGMRGGEAAKSCGFSVADEVDEGVKAEYLIRLDHDEPATLVNMLESGDGSLSCSAENWGGLGADGLFDESGSSYQWWDCLP